MKFLEEHGFPIDLRTYRLILHWRVKNSFRSMRKCPRPFVSMLLCLSLAVNSDLR